MLFLKATKTFKQHTSLSTNFIIGKLDVLNVKMTNPCENYPSLNMDEKCRSIFIFFLIHFLHIFFFCTDEIIINNSSGLLLASSIWGILRGLETFSQLVYLETDGSTVIFLKCCLYTHANEANL